MVIMILNVCGASASIIGLLMVIFWNPHHIPWVISTLFYALITLILIRKHGRNGKIC